MVACVRGRPGNPEPRARASPRTLLEDYQMNPAWFKQRRYRHFDRPVSSKFIESCQLASVVSSHSFAPLIRFEKTEKRYKKKKEKDKRLITLKRRPICYPSHRDACILDMYSDQLKLRLEAHYHRTGISDAVIAYRSLGKANYHFAAEALAFAETNSPVVILAFDVTGFFDNLNHQLLKERLKRILGTHELPDDWYKVFRFISQYRFVDIETLKTHPQFKKRFANRSSDPIATIAELKAAQIPFLPNPTPGKGIPQGTPISAAASNLYMIDFDAAATQYFNQTGALYRRYSDDILVICRPDLADAAEAKILELINSEKLQIAQEKTERSNFSCSVQYQMEKRCAQYLGFHLQYDGASIRPSSLSRQWRRMRRSMKRAHRIAERQIGVGKQAKVYTKKLRRRFTNLKVYDGRSLRSVRNFSSYGRRSADAFGSQEKITKQLRRFEKAAERELQELKSIRN